MSFTEKEITVIGWILVPILTAVITYYQQRSAQKKADEKTRIKEIETFLESLQNDANKYWIVGGDSVDSTHRSIKIKSALKKLEKLLPQSQHHLLVNLRLDISGGEFDNPEREGLLPTNEKFHAIELRISAIHKALV